MKAFVIAVVLLTLCAGSSLYAQTHTAQNDSMVAAGWTYVRSFDSVYDVSITAAYGDTLIIGLGDVRPGKPSGTFFSLDGGLTLDHQWQYFGPASPASDYYEGYIFNHDPIRIVVPSNYPDAHSYWADTIYLSTNLGTVNQKFFVDTAQFHFPRGEVKYARSWLDPTDNGTIYIEFGQRTNNPDFPEMSYSYIVRSTDTGKTWTHLLLPYPRYGVGVERNVLMDERQHGKWYAMATDGDETVIDWYKTEDDGKDFNNWNGLFDVLGSSWPVGNGYTYGQEQAGIGYPGEIRKHWGYEPGYDIARGIVTWNGDSGNDYKVMDWADSLVPGIPDTLTLQNGWYFGTSIFYFADSNFILLPIGIDHQSQNGGPYDSNHNWWFYSSDGGRSFTKIWDDTEWYGIFSMDKRNPRILWAIIPPKQWGDTGTYSIYKREMPRSTSRVVSGTESPTDSTWVRLYSSKMEIGNLPPGAAHFDLYNILGQRLISSPLAKGDSETTIDFSHSLSEGAYFVSLLLSDGRVLKVVPVILQ